jgi:hypothetical protein
MASIVRLSGISLHGGRMISLHGGRIRVSWQHGLDSERSQGFLCMVAGIVSLQGGRMRPLHLDSIWSLHGGGILKVSWGHGLDSEALRAF